MQIKNELCHRDSHFIARRSPWCAGIHVGNPSITGAKNILHHGQTLATEQVDLTLQARDDH
jgi:hypothetical protein